MSVMYVIITCDVGFEKSVIAELKTINFVKEVKEVIGEYDILVKLELDNLDELKNIIPSKISFHQKYHSIKNIIPSKISFHQKFVKFPTLETHLL
jgi:DNA-binding Lrp family transcriptional regulator